MSSEPCSECDGYETVIVDGEEVHCTTCSLRAEIERLRAAGDALAEALASAPGYRPYVDVLLDAWEEARRG